MRRHLDQFWAATQRWAYDYSDRLLMGYKEWPWCGFNNDSLGF